MSGGAVWAVVLTFATFLGFMAVSFVLMWGMGG